MTELHFELAGQWIGDSKGEYDARIVIDLDAINGRSKGTLYFFPTVGNMPPALAELTLPDTLESTEVSARLVYFNGDIGYIPTIYEINQAYPSVNLSKEVHIEFSLTSDDTIKLNWKTDLNFYGSAEIFRTNGNRRSKVASESEVTNWKEFQDYVTSEYLDSFIYRGQSFPWPLQTSFHRSKRKDLFRYMREDIPRLHRALTGKTRHIFDLSKPQENGAFLNLAQHHGFPTPLLDWTLSPFVAAYFAYSSVDDQTIGEPVRIFALDQKRFRSQWEQLQVLAPAKPHISILEALAIENERMIPQQAILTLTNLHDIESYIQKLENDINERYLYSFDLPRSETKKALHDLRLMGITQATLFPGIDSICKELKNVSF